MNIWVVTTLGDYMGSLVAQMVKRLSAMQETWVQSLGWEDPLEKEIAAHSSFLAWKIPWTEEPDELHKSWAQLSDFIFFLSYTGWLYNPYKHIQVFV